MGDYQGIIWGPSIRSIRDHNRKRLNEVRHSLSGLKKQDGKYAEDHRMLVALYQELCDVIDKHTIAAQTILPAPVE